MALFSTETRPEAIGESPDAIRVQVSEVNDTGAVIGSRLMYLVPRPGPGSTVTLLDGVTGEPLNTATLTAAGRIPPTEDQGALAVTISYTVPDAAGTPTTVEIGPMFTRAGVLSVLGQAANIAQLNASASAAAASASQAAASAVAARIWAAAAIPLTQKGIADGVGTLGTDGRQPLGEVAQSVLDTQQALSEQIAAVPTGGMPFVERWGFFTSDGSLASGFTDETVRVPAAGIIRRSPEVKLDDYHATTASVFDVLVNGASIFGTGAKPTVPAGATVLPPANGPVPTNQAVALDDLVTVRCVTAAPPASTSSTAATFPGVDGEYASSASPAAPSAHVVPIPAGGAAGDVVLVGLLSASGTATHAAPAGWTALGTKLVVDGAGTGVFRLSLFAAPWSATLGNSFTTSAGTPTAGWARLVRGTDVTLLDVVYLDGAYQPGGGAWAIPARTAANAYDLLIEMFGAWYPSAVTGYSQTLTGGPSGLTEEADLLTGRATGSNVGLDAATRAGAIASGASIASTTTTLGGGTGSTANVSFVGAVVGIRRAPGSHGPTRAVVSVTIEAA